MKNLIFADIFNKIKAYMRKFIYSLLIICGFIHAANTQTIQEGIRQLENENYNSALTIFNKLAQNDPKGFIYHYYIGEVYYAMEKYPDARKAYSKGLDISSKCDQCRIGLGKMDLDDNKPGDAKKQFESALKGNTKNPQIQALIGIAYLYSKKAMAEQALQYLVKARDLDPKQAKFWIYLGDAYQAKGDLGNAMTSYETAVEKDKNDPETYVKMARIWADGKQIQLAIEKLERAIQLKPDYAIAYKDLYELYIRSGKFDKVVPILEKYVSLIGTDIDAKVRFVKFLCYQAKDYSRAIEEGSKLVKQHPDQYTLHRWLAWSNFEKGNFSASLDDSYNLFREAKKDSVNRLLYPSDYEFAARAAAKLNKMDTAEFFFKKIMQLQPERSVEISSALAKSYYDARDYEKAINWYLEKDKHSGLTVSELFYLGLAQKNIGRLLRADSTFAKMLELSPKYDWGWYTRAQINNELDTSSTQKLFLAQPHYEKFIELASADPIKNKERLIEAYLYMIYYSAQKDDLEMAKSYCNLVLNLNPEHKTANEYLKLLNGKKAR
jgi:tetratricopeptide (TPR) repeat protein